MEIFTSYAINEDGKRQGRDAFKNQIYPMVVKAKSMENNFNVVSTNEIKGFFKIKLKCHSTNFALFVLKRREKLISNEDYHR